MSIVVVLNVIQSLGTRGRGTEIVRNGVVHMVSEETKHILGTPAEGLGCSEYVPLSIAPLV